MYNLGYNSNNQLKSVCLLHRHMKIQICSFHLYGSSSRSSYVIYEPFLWAEANSYTCAESILFPLTNVNAPSLKTSAGELSLLFKTTSYAWALLSQNQPVTARCPVCVHQIHWPGSVITENQRWWETGSLSRLKWIWSNGSFPRHVSESSRFLPTGCLMPFDAWTLSDGFWQRWV